jgi:DNA invertase Pin-like site-specific DNA recombinase
MYARVSSKEQDREGFSIPAQTKLMKDYADANDIQVAREFVDVETAKKSGRTSFNEMLQYVRRHPTVRTLLVEKTDRLYRNLKDWVTVDDLDIEIHFVKEGVVLSQDSRSSEKFMHGIKVLMAKNYIDNLSEETRKGMLEKAEQGLWPTVAPIGYLNVEGPNGKKIITIDPALAPSMIDEFPVLFVAAAMAQGTTVSSGLEELRVKESDRLSAMASALTTAGVRVEEREDGLVITGSGGEPLSGGAPAIVTHLYHRIAMSMAVAGLVSRDGVEVDDTRPIATSFPTFEPMLESLQA